MKTFLAVFFAILAAVAVIAGVVKWDRDRDRDQIEQAKFKRLMSELHSENEIADQIRKEKENEVREMMAGQKRTQEAHDRERAAKAREARIVGYRRRFFTVDASKREAVRLFPDIGKEGSSLNRAFAAEYTDALKHDPTALSDPLWPLIIAEKITAQ